MAAIQDLLFRLADDDLIMGHRSSEWTGLGPVLEEDIAFSSMAQDQIGHAYSYFQLLENLTKDTPDKLAFLRNEQDYKCCHLVEYPIGDYEFSLMRHFLYEIAKEIRLDALQNCSYAPLQQLSQKIRKEHKYHSYHAFTWVTQLSAKGNEDSKMRMQSALIAALPLAFSLFEPSSFENELVSQNMLCKEEILEEKWFEKVCEIFNEVGIDVPNNMDRTVFYGGRKGKHSPHFTQLLEEMTSVFRIEPNAEW